ncbi:hypothetical protein [Nocardia aurea]|uniref:hypothetical protein n=1 Tax=Nocardia aurea TaxID=2144174 RepID=UPI00339DEE7E
MTTRGVGFLRLDISGDQAAADANAIAVYAARERIGVEHMLEVPRGAIDPTLRLVDAMNRFAASVVIIPALRHINETKRTVTERWELRAVDSGNVWPVGYRWPSPLGQSGWE